MPDQAKFSGANKVIEKPVNFDVLMATIQQYCSYSCKRLHDEDE
jgi:FixJ family two-component response regulator